MAGVELTPATRRQTSKVIDAPDPPAMEETTSTRGGAVMSGAGPAPGTACDTRTACSWERGLVIRARADCTAFEMSRSRVRTSRRPIPRNCPAPTVTGNETSLGRRGIQVAS